MSGGMAIPQSNTGHEPNSKSSYSSKSPTDTEPDWGILGNSNVLVHTLKGSHAVFGLQETVLLVTQRAREALKYQRATARLAWLHQQKQFLAATHHHEAAARKNLISAKW